MHTDKENPMTAPEQPTDTLESSQEATLNWLLELDRDEPQENLFVVDTQRPVNMKLSAFEAEIAARPMTRGRAGADDFDTYVGEEIVISSDTGSDIYSSSNPVEESSGADDQNFDEAMALDFTHRDSDWADVVHATVEDGADILGLEDDDDIGIGDAFLVVKRSKKAVPPKPAPVAELESVPELSPVDEIVVDLPEIAATSSVQDYVSAVEAPADELEFDEHLVAGSELAHGENEIEELTLELEEGELYPGADLGSELEIDLEIEYPEDFQSLADSAPEAPLVASAPALEVVDNSVFDDDLLIGDLDAELAPEGWDPGQSDIDAIFDDLGGSDLGGSDLELEFDDLPIEESAFVDPAAAEVEDTVAGAGDETLQVQSAPSEEIDALFDDFDEADGAAELAEAPGQEQEQEPAPRTEDAIPGEDMSWCIPADIRFSYSSPANSEIFAEFLDAFIEEGSSELEKLEDAVVEWENNVSAEAAYTAVARILHTIKGIAKGVGLHYYGTLIHNFETLLERMPRPDAGGEQAYFRIVNAWLDAVVRGLDHIQAQRVDISCEFPQRGGELPATAAESGLELSPEAAQITTVPVVEPEEPETAQEPASKKVRATPTAAQARRKELDKQLADEGAKALAAQQSVRITSEKLDLLLNLTNQAQQLGVRTAQSTTRTKRTSAELQARLSSVRTHIADIADRALFNVTSRGTSRSSELDALEMDQYSEIQEAANILREGVEDLAELIEIASRHNAQAEVLLKQQATVVSSIGSSIRAARVVPVSRLMPGLRRLVRTVSNDLDKEVAFRVANEVGTLDRDDYARCQTILEHMVRNALDHGVETADQRRESGKPSVGQITVDVRMSGADSVIVLSDDGRGIDPEKMRESAMHKGLEIDVEALSDEEALGLIFHKGFSTAKSVSQISGRGVGMDIVLSELQQMGGDIRIESEVGKGTSFHIRIPSNVTVNGALLVTTGENSYAIPLGGLVAVDQVPVDDFFAAVESGERLQLSGMSCDPAYLGSLCQSGNLPDKAFWRSSVPVIIAGSEQRYMAIAIDDVEEALELVIRSLGAQFAAVPGVAGAATTADGEAVVALDLNVLVACFEEGQGTAVTVEQPGEEKFLALVVDDSRTQRMVATSQLETVGIETATAENGAVAIDWLNTTEHLPDVILLDVEMPVKDGIQTLREIRKSARYSHIPVIMVTSRTGVKHRTLAEEAGCSGYMGKPFNFRMLIGQINELTGHRLELG